MKQLGEGKTLLKMTYISYGFGFSLENLSYIFVLNSTSQLQITEYLVLIIPLAKFST